MSGTMSGSQAMPAADFIDSIGVNTHLDYYNTAYANVTAAIADLAYLGIDHVRDAAPITTDADYWTSFEQAMAAGIKFDLVIPQNEMNIQADLATLNALETAHPGGIAAIEGVNESTASAFFAGLTGEAAVNAFQAQLYAAVHGDAKLAGVKVYNYTLNTFNSAAFTQFGNISAESDYGNAHSYFGYQAPELVNPWLVPLQLGGTPNHPFVVTETGYDTMPGQAADGSQGVSDDVQAKYTLDDVFDLIKAGASTVYLYELLDEMADPNMTDHEQHFGLFNNNGTPKEAAVAIHDLTSLLADTGTTATTFTPGSLPYTITNLPSTGNAMLLAKSNGSFDLAIWAEPAIWNPTTLQEIAIAAAPITVTLGQTAGTVRVFDPLSGTSPIAAYSNVNQITVGITDHPLILDIAPVSPLSQVDGIPPIVACVLEGTRIETVSGAVPVEALRVDDLVVTASGAARPVAWIGWRAIDVVRHPDPAAVCPVRVREGAFAPGVPARDLWLSPDHAVLAQGVLIAVKHLVNGATVIQDRGFPAVRYFHVELARHDVMIAEGLAVETYLDTGNRGIFDNAVRAA